MFIKKAFSLIELLLILSIILILAIGAFFVFKNVALKNKANQEAQYLIQTYNIFERNYSPAMYQNRWGDDALNEVYSLEKDLLTLYIQDGIYPQKNEFVKNDEDREAFISFQNKFGGVDHINAGIYSMTNVPVEVCDIILSSWNSYLGENKKYEPKLCSKYYESDGDNIDMVDMSFYFNGERVYISSSRFESQGV